MASGYLDKVTSLVDEIISEKNKKAKEKAKSKNEVSEYTAEKQELDRITMTKTIMSTISVLDDEEAKKVLEIIQVEVNNSNRYLVNANGSLDIEGFKNELKVIISDSIGVSQKFQVVDENTTQNKPDLEIKLEEASKNLKDKRNFNLIMDNFDQLSNEEIGSILVNYTKLTLEQQKTVEEKAMERKKEEFLKKAKDPESQARALEELEKTYEIMETYNEMLEILMARKEKTESVEEVESDTEEKPIFVKAIRSDFGKKISKKKDKNKSKSKISEREEKGEDEKPVNILEDASVQGFTEILLGIKAEFFTKFFTANDREQVKGINEREDKLVGCINDFLYVEKLEKIDNITQKFIRDNPVYAKKIEKFRSQFDYMSLLRNEHQSASYEDFRNSFIEAGMGGLLAEIESKVPLKKVFELTRPGLKKGKKESFKRVLDEFKSRQKDSIENNTDINLETNNTMDTANSFIEVTPKRNQIGLRIESIDNRGIFKKSSRNLAFVESESDGKLFGTEDLKGVAEEIKIAEVKTALGKVKDIMSLGKSQEENKTKQALSTDDNDQEIGE